MNGNCAAAAVFCGGLVRDGRAKPLGAKEWHALCENLISKGVEPCELMNFSERDFKFFADEGLCERLVSLLNRREEVIKKLSEYEKSGITAVTAGDSGYPEKLKKTLGAGSPAVMFSAGDPSVLNENFVGYVGSRNADKDDLDFARFAVSRTAARGFGVCSGGARGVDDSCEDEALNLGSRVLEFPSDGMIKRLKRPKILNAVKSGKMLILSLAPPDAGFNLGIAMMRNRLIYAQSQAAIAVRADYNKGGTWAGVTDNLKHGWCKQIVRINSRSAGNTALIELGAIPTDYGFDGDVLSLNRPETPIQLSLF